MAQRIVECPVCEGQFQIPSDLDSSRVICPNCKQEVDLAESIPVAKPVAETPTARPSPADQVGFDIAVRNKKGVRSTRRRNRNQKSTMIVWLVLTPLVALALGGLLYINSAPNPDNENPGDRTQAQTDTANGPAPTLADPAPLSPPPRPKYFFYTSKQADECWKTVRPHLVLLNIEDPRGTTQATGTIVDSRGWVLTSYSAIKNAWRIGVTAAGTEFDPSNTTESLTDVARGIVAVDPENDFAILAVNRRFVVSLAGLKMVTNNRVVAGESFFHCGPPTSANYYGTSEVKIEQRLKRDHLAVEVQALAEARKLSDDISWLRYSGGMGSLPGTPLFRPDGTLVAMTAMSENGFGYAVPIHDVHPLVKSATGDLQPLKLIPQRSVDSGDHVPAIANQKSEVETGLSTRPITDSVNELQRMAKICRKFEWLPGSASQYSSFQEFVRVASVAQAYIDEHREELDNFSSNNDKLLELSKLTHKIRSEMREYFKNALHKNYASLRQLNKFAQIQIQKGKHTPVIYFGEVVDGGATIVTKMEGSDSMVSFSNSPDNLNFPVMLPATFWIFYVETPELPQPTTVSISGQGSVKTHFVRFRMAISTTD